VKRRTSPPTAAETNPSTDAAPAASRVRS
jgi:hypothetical protein